MRHRWSTRVRVSELGPDGTVSARVLVDWMQEAAFEHCDRAGWSVDRLRAAGALWFVRDLDLWIDAPVGTREAVYVETWVSDRRRFRTHREYRIRSGERTVARARAEWLFLARSGEGVKPSRIPDDMAADFELEPEVAVPADALPALDPAAPAAPGVPRRVWPSETDAHHHVNHAIYLDWIDDAVGRRSSAYRLRFLKDALPGDQLELAPTPLGIRIRRGEDRLVEAVLLGPRPAEAG